MKAYLLLIALTLLIPSASAGVVDDFQTGVAEGIEGFFISTADMIFSMSFGGFDNATGYGTMGYIYNIATYTSNPFDSELVLDLIEYSKSVFKQVYPILIICALISVMICHYRPDVIQQLSQITGVNISSKTNELSNKAIKGIVIAVFMYTFIYLILYLNDALTKSVMISIIDTIAPTADNFVLYFMMALAYLFMGFFFSMRILFIYLFCGFAFLIGLGLMIDCVKDSATGLCAYFVQTVFFQFLVVIYFSASILIIKSLPVYATCEATMYLVMILGGVYIAIKMLFGTKVIRFVGNAAAKLV